MKKMTVGRRRDCDICLNNQRVSGVHAELFSDEHGDVWISDLQSTNGTFVDGHLIQRPTKLSPGALVYIADVAFNWESAVKNTWQTSIEPGSAGIEKPPISGPAPPKTKNSLRIYLGAAVLLVMVGAALLVVNGYFKIPPIGDNPFSTKETEPTNIDDDSTTQLSGNEGTSTSTNPAKRQPRWLPKKNPITYDYSCLDDESGLAQIIRTGADIQNTVIELSGSQISIDDEMKVGDEVKQDILEQHKIWNDKPAQKRTEQLFKDLVASIDQPRGIRYELFMIDSDEVNAFTIGGKVFFFRGMYKFINSDDELVAVLAHEIQHNERGHLTRMLKKMAIAEGLFGDAAMIPILADQVLLSVFGQKDESECDLHGVDHIVRLGYDGCAAAGLWERFAQNEKEDEFEKLIRSHPYSKDRKNCIVAHINTTYGHDCRK